MIEKRFCEKGFALKKDVGMKYISTITTHACHCEGQSPEAISEKVPQSLFWQTMLAVCVSFFAMILLLPCFAFAEVRIFEKEYTYQASEIDSKVTSRAIAVEQVKRLVLEELGAYLMAETEVRDFQITKDRVVMLTAGIVQTEILNEKWDGERYYLKARIKADPKEVAASLDALRKDAQKSKELEDVKKKADEAFKEIEKLKSELEAVKADKNKQKEYAKAADTLSAADWFKKGYQYYLNKEYDSAIEAYTKAIVLDPNYADAYNIRGAAYGSKGQYDRAIEDFNKAIQLNPNAAVAYASRGAAYGSKGQYDRAIEDFNKAIALDPKDALAYGIRGLAYYMKRQYDRAIEDYNKAIALDSNIPMPYLTRGLAYNIKGNMGMAISDFRKACDLGFQQGCESLQKALKER